MPSQSPTLGFNNLAQSNLAQPNLAQPNLETADLAIQDLDLQDIHFLMETAAIGLEGIGLEDMETAEYDPTMVVNIAIDVNKAFPLINQVLPFEACLYHQILPLDIEDNQIFLGMVNLDDSAALDYARKILAFLKYKVITQTIPSDAHHRVLSAYLSHQAKLQSTPALPPPSTPEPVAAAESESLRVEPVVEPGDETGLESPESGPESEAQSGPESEAQSEVQSEAQLQFEPIVEPESLAEDHDDTPETLQLLYQDALTQWPIARHAPPNPLAAASHHPSQAKPTKPIQAIPGSALPELTLQFSPHQPLRSLPPQEFLHALLAKVIHSGVGRLFLAKPEGKGRILWTESGMVKAVLADLDIGQLQGAIDELKVLTHLPILPVQTPVEVEIERIFQRQRVLLRLRITPKPTGEEATLQILRGAALKFYQQQQIKTLSRDTLTIAADLRQKMAELQRRTQTDTTVGENERAIVAELDRVVAHIEQHLSEIKQIRDRFSVKGYP